MNSNTHMTVKDLIKTLRQIDPEAIVVVDGYEGGMNPVIAADSLRVAKVDRPYCGLFDRASRGKKAVYLKTYN